MTPTAVVRGELIGRDHERAVLEGALAELKAGRGGIALLAGDAGVGKTRLAEEAMQVEKVLVLRGDAPEQSTSPYGPIVAALRAFLRVDPHDALERQIIASPNCPLGVVMAARSALAIFQTARGRARGTRRLLVEGLTYARQNDRLRFEFNCLVGLAWLDELEGADSGASTRYHEIVRRRGETEDKHYAPMALRSAVTFFATHAEPSAARACAAELADMAAATTNRETLAALAHALGEVALLEGEPGHAAVEFARALDLLRELELPHARAQTQIRAAVAFAVAGERQQAVERLTDAYHTARKLGAHPLAAVAARRLEDLGERVDQRLGRRAAGDLERGGLTRRELEVMRFVAVGRTNREIAAELFLSKRTVDMHVRNILMKLSCSSRTEATRRAWELRLVD